LRRRDNESKCDNNLEILDLVDTSESDYLCKTTGFLNCTISVSNRKMNKAKYCYVKPSSYFLYFYQLKISLPEGRRGKEGRGGGQGGEMTQTMYAYVNK
jgi:hypothetical protein